MEMEEKLKSIPPIFPSPPMTFTPKGIRDILSALYDFMYFFIIFVAKIFVLKYSKVNKLKRKTNIIKVFFYFSFKFFQSFKNLSIPISVKGCFISFSNVWKGIVAISAPIRADSIKCIGCLTDATITSVSKR